MNNSYFDPDYLTYEQWKEEKRKKELKIRKRRTPAIVVFSILICIGLFTSGMTIGSMYSGVQKIDTTLSNQQTVDNSTLEAQSDVKLEITEKNYSEYVENGLSGEEIYDKVSPSVVSIISQNFTDGSEGTGSGIIMSEDGYIVTNYHVIEGANKLTIYLNDGQIYAAEVIGYDDQTDLAVIKIEAETPLTPAEFGDSDELATGQRAFAIGSPSGLELQNSITGGYISAINRDLVVEDRVMTLIQTDTSINPGNSGGPLINQYGQVVGINTIKLGVSYYEGLGFAIPINSVKTVVDELIAYGFVTGRPAIGISGSNISAEAAYYYGIPQGVSVQYIDPRGNAEAAGIKIDDIIVGINGQTIVDMTELNKIKETFSAGDTITLNIYRMSNDKYIDIELILVDETGITSTTP